jgi:hypothetical protein
MQTSPQLLAVNNSTAITLNRRRIPHPHGSYACLPCKITLFRPLSTVVKCQLLPLLSTFYCSATIPPQLLLRHPLPQQLHLFVAQNRLFLPFCRSCQVRQACGASGGHASQNTLYRHKFGRLFPCCRRFKPFLSRHRCRR